VLNRKGVPYPQFTNPLTGRAVHYPGDNLEQVHPESQRVGWKTTERLRAQRQWAERYGGPPAGGWKGNYQLHHIRPRLYGGTNDLDNLVPLSPKDHVQYSNWWLGY
jgi:HNH endonuclease